MQFEALLAFLDRVPDVEAFAHGVYGDGNWWVKLCIQIEHELAWNVVQEFGFVLNYVSVDERLPTAFYPVSPPPYMNGGPSHFLSWIVESKQVSFTPRLAAEWLERRLPRPVEDRSLWPERDDA